VNAELLKHFKKGAWLVNTARGAICDKDAVADAIKSGHLNGYSGDVWNVQPAPKEHVWRTMKNPLGGGNGMVPHYSGTTLDAQIRYANGVKSILENYFENKPQGAWLGAGSCKSMLTRACRAGQCHHRKEGLRDQGL
jgi:formate dehydrogenase